MSEELSYTPSRPYPIKKSGDLPDGNTLDTDTPSDRHSWKRVTTHQYECRKCSTIKVTRIISKEPPFEFDTKYIDIDGVVHFNRPDCRRIR